MLSSCSSSFRTANHYKLDLVKRNAVSEEQVISRSKKAKSFIISPQNVVSNTSRDAHDEDKIFPSERVFSVKLISMSTQSLQNKATQPVHENALAKKEKVEEAKKKNALLSFIFSILTLLLMVFFSVFLMEELVLLSLVLGILSGVTGILAIIFGVLSHKNWLTIISLGLFMLSSGIALISALLLLMRLEY